MTNQEMAQVLVELAQHSRLNEEDHAACLAGAAALRQIDPPAAYTAGWRDAETYWENRVSEMFNRPIASLNESSTSARTLDKTTSQSSPTAPDTPAQ